MISILIVDDDLNKISSIISSVHKHYKDQVEIKQASNVQEALEVLQNNEFHLLITDLLMPLRIGESPVEKGGENLIKEIYKGNNKVNTPIYIVGLTQFDNVKHNFSAVWKVWNYDSSNEDWKIRLRDLVFHISRVNSKIIKEKNETLFVEGPTDKDILNTSFDLFFKNEKKGVTIETISFGGGAKWVERQLIIWGKTLFWKDKEKTRYLKAVGLFDNDEAGNKSIESVRDQISANSAEHKTFSIIKLDRKYSKHLIPVYLEGLKIPITLEEMYAPFCWEFAKKQNWLVNRDLSEASLIDPLSLRRTNGSLNEYVTSLPSYKNGNLYINFKIGDAYKTSLAKYIQNLDSELQKEALYAFKPLINDILIKLKIKKAD